MKRALINPLVLLLGVWGVVFLLFSLHLSSWLIELPTDFALLALATALCATLGYVGAYLLPSKPRGLSARSITSHRAGALSVVKLLFAVMCVIFPLEVIVSGGMPIFWLLTGSSKTYVDYGIPTLHGFFNAILLFEGTLCFWLITATRASRLVKLIFVLCLLLPIAAITRQVVMSLLAQCFVIFVGARLRGRRIKYGRIALTIVLIMALFSVIGIVRTNSAAFRQQVAYRPGFEWVPVAFMWPYMYFTTPLNNFAYITSLDLEPTLGYSSLSSLTPTVIREMIWGPKSDATLVTETFNVTSFAAPIYLDFGWLGVMLFTFTLILCAVFVFRRLIRTNSLYYLMLLAILDHIIILSFFFNFLLTWGVVFQFVILTLVKPYIVRTNAAGMYAAPSLARQTARRGFQGGQIVGAP
jgi:oligosaccharide repeat unit polymerase